MKTIQLVGVGAQAEGNNANVTPGFPSGGLIGDTVLIMATIRNSGTGIVNTPTGWKTLLMFGNMSLVARTLVRGDSVSALPTISFTGGAANATTIARAYAIRYNQPDVDLLIHASATQLNGSAQNIATPALTVTTRGCLALHLGWKQGVWTSVAVPAGDTSLAEFSSALGSDSAQVMSGVVQTVAADLAASSFVATGGAANISRSATLALLAYATTWTSIAGTDDPCDFPTEFNLVSNSACAAIAAIDAEILSISNAPAVRLSATSGVVTVDSTIPFSSVDIDPTGIADLVSDPYSVTTVPGIWAHGHNVNTQYSGTGGNQIQFGSTDNSLQGMSVRDMDATDNPSGGGGAGGASSLSISDTSSILRVGTEVSITGIGTPAQATILIATEYLFRVSD